jgi:hypothetical protein
MSFDTRLATELGSDSDPARNTLDSDCQSSWRAGAVFHRFAAVAGLPVNDSAAGAAVCLGIGFSSRVVLRLRCPYDRKIDATERTI